MTQDWRGRPEVGVQWIISAYASCARRIGRPLARLSLMPIALYFFAVRAPERRASRQFLKRALGRPVRSIDVLKHFWTFSQVVLDRVYLLGAAEPPLQVTAQQPELLEQALEQGRGCLLVGSHLGSFEAGRIISRRRPDVNLRIVMDRSISPNATRMLEALNPALADQVIDASVHRGTLALRIGESLAKGDLVAVLGDRIAEGDRSLAVNFLGEQASFPLSPFALAAATHAPVILFFGLYEGGKRYRVVFESFADSAMPRSAGRRRLDGMVQAYADRLAHHARSAPFNWFNFFPFWDKEST